MNIGSKLKNSRTKAGLTQEVVAEKLGVSRQTISNWENSRSYPDIISVIGLSNLYSISLDEMLKEDESMIKHLEKSTNDVKSRRKFAKLIQIIAYLVIWATSIIVFWVGGKSEAMGYSLVVFYLVLPITTFVISIFIGKSDGWSNYKWLLPLFFGLMYMLATYGTFSLANAVAFRKTNLPEMMDMLPGILFSVIGLLIGILIDRIKSRKAR